MPRYKNINKNYKMDTAYIAKHLAIELDRVSKLAAIEIEEERLIEEEKNMKIKEKLELEEKFNFFDNRWKNNKKKLFNVGKETDDIIKMLKAILYIKKENKIEMYSQATTSEKLTKGEHVLNSMLSAINEWKEELESICKEYGINKDTDE